MKRRILKVTRAGEVYFVPQYCLDGDWVEFVGFNHESGSPYLNIKMFKSLYAARIFLAGPGLFRVGDDGVEEVSLV